MHATILQENLLKALTTVSQAVPNRPSMPILSNVLLTAKANSVVLFATDLSYSHAETVGAQVEDDGMICVNATVLRNVVGTMQGKIRLETTDSKLKVISTTRVAVLPLTGTEGYPVQPQMEEPITISLSGKAFKDAVAYTEYSAAKDDNRPVLQGISLKVQHDTLAFAAADGYRLALYETTIDPTTQELQAIVPAPTLKAMAKAVEEDDALTLSFDKNRFRVSARGLIMTSNLIDGTFPDYQAIIPKINSGRFYVQPKPLAEAVKAALIFAKDSAGALEFQSSVMDDLEVSGASQEKGSTNSTLPLTAAEGVALSISLNGQFVADVLKVLANHPYIKFSFTTGGMPLLITVDKLSFQYVIMPMSVGR